jgi:hypothetical protein
MKHICPLCKSEYDKVESTAKTEKEQFIEFWTPTVGAEEAEKSWEAKQAQERRYAPMVQSDIQGYVSQIDGSWIDSKSKHRNHLKEHGCIEVGNEKMSNAAPKQDPQLKQRIAEIAYEKLRYR